jgi:hypothetical protein
VQIKLLKIKGMDTSLLILWHLQLDFSFSLMHVLTSTVIVHIARGISLSSNHLNVHESSAIFQDFFFLSLIRRRENEFDSCFQELSFFWKNGKIMKLCNIRALNFSR